MQTIHTNILDLFCDTQAIFDLLSRMKFNFILTSNVCSCQDLAKLLSDIWMVGSTLHFDDCVHET